MKILLAADGSEYTKRTARHLASHLKWFAEKPVIHVLHVHPPLPYPRAAAVVGKEAVTRYQREDSEEALAVATKELDAAGIRYTAHWRVGRVEEVIAAYVAENGIELLVMGSHGHGALESLVLGSVATKVLATTKVPVLIVR
jgi:nucleotide-binding universal stress UspA family protein